MPTNKKKAGKKAGKKAAPKKAAPKKKKKKKKKKAAPKKAAPKKAAPNKKKKSAKKGAGVGNGTPAQKKAAAATKGVPRIQWRAEVERFRKAKAKNMKLELSTPGSAQVTRVRLTQSDYCKGLTVRTEGAFIFFKKGS